jgi:hypothetical protein
VRARSLVNSAHTGQSEHVTRREVEPEKFSTKPSWWRSHSGPWRAVVALCLVCVVPLSIVGVLVWNVHSTWHKLDEAADDFGIPPGFTEVERVRSGTAACFVTCTNGGEAVVTVILDPGSLSVPAACDAMEKAVRDFIDDAGTELEPALGFYECDFGGPLAGTMRMGGAVEHAKDLCEGCGERWLDDVDVPEHAHRTRSRRDLGVT